MVFFFPADEGKLHGSKGSPRKVTKGFEAS